DSDPEGLLAARVSLGALGIASEIELECVPLYTLTRIDKPLPLDETLDRLDEHVDSNDHFEFFLWPYTRTAMTRSTMRSDAAPDAELEARVPGAARRERRARRDLPHRAALPEPGPAAEPRDGRRDDRVPCPGPRVSRLRRDPQRPLHGDGIRDPARARARGA